MSSKWLFLRWALLVSLVTAANLIIIALGWFVEIDNLDRTFISYTIIAIFWSMTAYSGFLTWKADCLIDDRHLGPIVLGKALDKIEHQADNVKYAENLCERLGMLGTVCGFLMMLLGAGGFSEIQSTDQNKVTQLIEQLGVGLSTAFLTTLVGAVCGIILGIQHRNLSRAIERKIDEIKK